MYGTVARMKIKAGQEPAIQQLIKVYQDLKIDGHVSTTLYRADGDANELWMAVAFRDKAAYMKNADSPGQNDRYQQMRALLTADPEWHDGEIIHTG